MRRFLQFIGTLVYYCAWPAFFVYFKVGHGRTRVVLVYEGKVLVMKQWISPGKWGLPGGGIHRGEDPVDGAVRELLEETSLRLDQRQLRDVGDATYRRHGLAFDYRVFASKVGTPSVRAQRIEVSELEWLDADSLTAKNASPDTLLSLEMVRKKTALLQ